MARQRTGCAQWDPTRQVWRAILTIGEPGHTTRTPVDMPGIAEHDAEGAKAFARVLAQRAAARGATPAGSGETCGEWWTRYHDAAERGEVGRKNKGRPQVTAKMRRQRFRDYIAPHLASVPMAEASAADVHRVVVALNAAIRERDRFYALPEQARARHDGPKPGMSAKQAAHVWSELRSGFGEACRLGNVPGLKLRDDDPTDKVTPPTAGATREQAALYPSELLALLACEDVPLFRRATYAFAAYTGIRQSELRALRKRDVDAEHGLIRVCDQQRTNGADRRRTKTDAAVRDVPIHPHLAPLVERLTDGLGADDRILRVPPPEDCAEKLRADLARAGVTRPELTEDSERVQPFTFHGLRHTCLTHWAMASGNAWSLAASGHTDHRTAERYIARANLLRAGRFGEPHPALPAALIESSGFRSFVNVGGANSAKRKALAATPSGIETQSRTRIADAETGKNKAPRGVKRASDAARNVPKLDAETLRVRLERAEAEARELRAALAREQGDNVVSIKTGGGR